MSTLRACLLSAGLAVLGVAGCYLVSGSLRKQVVDAFRDLSGGQTWDRAAHKRILSALIASQLRGADERSYWISFVEGLSVMPAGSAAERRESFSRAADDLPTEAETWFSSSSQLDFWYLRFLTSLGIEAERRSEFNQADLSAWRDLQKELKAQGLGTDPKQTAKWRKLLEKTLALFSRSPNLSEASNALNEALKFQQLPGGLREAFFTEPAHDVEADSSNLGHLLYSYSLESSSGEIGPINAIDKDHVNANIDVTSQVKQFVIKRPWLDDTLLDKYRQLLRINGEVFFGQGGHLHLVPTHIIVNSEPRYVVSLAVSDSERVKGWIRSGACCALTVRGERRFVDPNSVLLYGSVVTGMDSRLKPEIFAVVSRVR
jgi:hypothetical protein